MAVDRLDYCYLETQDYKKARKAYECSLKVKIQLLETSEVQKCSTLASTYHQLGMVSQEVREYEEARSHYQQSLDIKIEYKDRYSQASTYHQLGRVSEELREYEEARSHYQQALKTFVEFNDNHNDSIALKSFNRLHQTTKDDSLLADVAKCINSTVEEVVELFDKVNSNNDT